jgi:hypothetical protein
MKSYTLARWLGEKRPTAGFERVEVVAQAALPVGRVLIVHGTARTSYRGARCSRRCRVRAHERSRAKTATDFSDAAPGGVRRLV